MKENFKWSNKVNAFAHYFAALDSVGLSSILKDDVVYDALSRQDWITLFEKQFESFRRNKIHHLKPISGVCSGCKKGCTGYTFLDEVHGFYVDFVIEVNEKGTIDFTECVNLKNELLIPNKKEQIFIYPIPYLDNDDIPF